MKEERHQLDNESNQLPVTSVNYCYLVTKLCSWRLLIFDVTLTAVVTRGLNVNCSTVIGQQTSFCHHKMLTCSLLNRLEMKCTKNHYNTTKVTFCLWTFLWDVETSINSTCLFVCLFADLWLRGWNVDKQYLFVCLFVCMLTCGCLFTEWSHQVEMFTVRSRVWNRQWIVHVYYTERDWSSDWRVCCSTRDTLCVVVLTTDFALLLLHRKLLTSRCRPK